VSKFECDIFLSYKREEKARVEQLAHKLRSVGLKVWFDTHLKSGDNFDEQIAGHLRASRMSLVCWTPGAIESNWVRAEASMAHASGKLVAAFLEPTELIPPFNLVQTEDLSDWNGEDDHAGWARLLTRIASLSDDQELKHWAELMGEGDAGRLRAWANAAPVGPLRATARFWLSEAASASAVRSAAKVSGKRARRVPWLAVSALVLAAAGFAAAAITYVDRGGVSKELEATRTQVLELRSEVKKSEVRAAEMQLAAEKALKTAGDLMTTYGSIEQRRQESFRTLAKIEDMFSQHPALRRQIRLVAPRWKDAAEAELDIYNAKLKSEWAKLDLSPAPATPRPQFPGSN
jgi:hypothetical protein